MSTTPEGNTAMSTLTDEQIVEWASNFVLRRAFNRGVAIEIAVEAAKFARAALAEQAKPAMSGTFSDCTECGMPCEPGEFHPYAACLMFKSCRDGTTVRANLSDLAEQAGQVVEQDDLTTLRHARIFLTTREKMHPDGLAQWDEMVARLAASPPEQGSDA